jgi:hypothetical protein
LKPLLALLGAGALLRTALALRTAVINTDGPMFLDIARRMGEGDLSAATKSWFHPVYPGLLWLTGGSETAGVVISILAGVLAGWPLWLLVRDLADERGAFISVAIYELHPAFVDFQSDIFAEGVFMLAAACALSGSVRFAVTGRGIWLGAAGAAVGWCTKSEGLIVALLAAVTVAWGAVSRREWKRPALAALVAVAVVGPYVVHLTVVQKRFTVTPKPSAQQMLGIREGDDVGTAGLWHERRAVHGPLVTSVWYTGYYTGNTFRVGYLGALVLGLMLAAKWGSRMKGKGWILGWSLFFIFCVGYTNFRNGHSVSPRYVAPPVGFALMLLGPFFVWVLDRCDSNRAARAALLVAAAVAVVAAGARSTIVGRRFEHVGFKEAGAWMKARTGRTGTVIASTSDKPVYYAGGVIRPVELPPKAETEFIVVEEKDDYRDEQMAPFVRLKTFPEAPAKRQKIVIVYGRAP